MGESGPGNEPRSAREPRRPDEQPGRPLAGRPDAPPGRPAGAAASWAWPLAFVVVTLAMLGTGLYIFESLRRIPERAF